MKYNELEIQASELPVVDGKQKYRYLDEVLDDGAYRQVAWQQISEGYVPLYDNKPLKIVQAAQLEDEFPDEMEE